MILTIDIGNSNIVLGGVKDEQILFEARLRTETTKTSDQYCIDLKNMMELHIRLTMKRTEFKLRKLFLKIQMEYLQQ